MNIRWRFLESTLVWKIFKYASNVIKIENKTQSIIIKNYEKAKHTDVNVCSQKIKYLD